MQMNTERIHLHSSALVSPGEARHPSVKESPTDSHGECSQWINNAHMRCQSALLDLASRNLPKTRRLGARDPAVPGVVFRVTRDNVRSRTSGSTLVLRTVDVSCHNITLRRDLAQVLAPAKSVNDPTETATISVVVAPPFHTMRV